MELKQLSNASTVFNKYVKCGRKPEHWEYVKQVRNTTCQMITNARETYFQNLG